MDSNVKITVGRFFASEAERFELINNYLVKIDNSHQDVHSPPMITTM